MLDLTRTRFQFLEPSISVYGPPDDNKRPALLLFHACNGVREHIHGYAQAAAKTGVRAFVIDSCRPRGWDLTASVTLVCSGLALQGMERSGDVLAAIWGISRRPDVDSDNLMLAGWSHGAWSVMDLLAQDLTQPNAARLKDADSALMAAIKGVFVVYPYINFPALSQSDPWLVKPQTLAILAQSDFLTPVDQAQRVLARLSAEGVPVESRIVDATHCFDEDGIHFGPLMSYDPRAHEVTQQALLDFLRRVFAESL